MWPAVGPLLLAALLRVAAAAAESASPAPAPAAHGHHHQQQQQASEGSVGLAAPQSWIPYRHSALSLQGVQNVLLSIEERLRGLDAGLYSARFAPRWELSLEQQGRRLEAVEARLGRLEALLEIRLDKLAESVSSRQLKEELSKDQMSRKFDSAYERLNHRLGYMEARLDVGISKLQSSLEMTGERVESVVRARPSTATSDSAILDLSANVADLRRRVDECQARSNDTVAAVASSSGRRLDDIATSLAQLRYDFNRTLASAGAELNDASDQASAGPGLPDSTDLVDKVVVAVEKHVSNLANKVTNMYNELWRRTQVLETLTKDSMSLANATRRELQDGLRSLSRRGAFHADREKQDTVGSLQDSMDVLAGIVHRRMTELGRKLDSSFQMLMLAQNLFLESCHRLQLDEPQLEAKLTTVLERILDTLHNRSATTMEEVQQVHEMLKSHHSHVVRTVAHNTNTVMKAAEEARGQAKQIERAIQEVTEALSAAGKDHAATLRHGHDQVDTRLANILGALQDLQEQLGEMVPDTSDSPKEIMTAEACLKNQQTLERIAVDVEKYNTMLLTKLEDRNHVTSCPIDVPDISNKIAINLKDKGTVLCKPTHDSKNLMHVVQSEFDKDDVVQKINDNEQESRSNYIPEDPDDIWTDSKVDLLSTTYSKHSTIANSTKSVISNHSSSTSVNDASQPVSHFFTNVGSDRIFESSTSENNIQQPQDPQRNLSESKWSNIVAIIHDTDTSGNKLVQKPSLTVIHKENLPTEKDIIDFSPSLNIPDAVHDQHDNVTFLARGSPEEQIQVIALLRKPANEETLEEAGSTLTRRSMNYSIDAKHENFTLLATGEPKNDSYENYERLQQTKNKEHDSQGYKTSTELSTTKTTAHGIHANNFSNSKNTSTNSSTDSEDKLMPGHMTDMHVSDFLKKILETYDTDLQVNKSIQDFWKVLLEKNHHLQSQNLLIKNGSNTELKLSNNPENTDDSFENKYGDYKEMKLNGDRMNITTIPEKFKDAKIQQYVNKLEEIANELSNRKESPFQSITGENLNDTDHYMEQQLLPADIIEDEDISSYK